MRATSRQNMQNMQPTLQRSGSTCYRQRVLSLSLYVLAVLCGAGVCSCLFLALDVVYLQIYAKLGLFVGMTKQMSDSKEIDSELLTLEIHVDLTSFDRHDFPRVNNSLCLIPYHLTLYNVTVLISQLTYYTKTAKLTIYHNSSIV